MSEYTDAERWLPVVGWKDFYEVSSHGRVRSLDRSVIMKNGKKRFHQGRILRPGPNNHGYLTVCLYACGARQTKLVHHLVLHAFVGPPPKPEMECRHGPNGQLDNHISQLRWGTSQENKADITKYKLNSHRQIVVPLKTVPNKASDAERWRPVIGYETYYEVSDRGNVRSLDRWVHDRAGGSRFRRGHMMSPNINAYGHLSVTLSKLGTKQSKTVHSLVLRAFVGPPKPGMISLHGPAGKLINSLDNLSWGTHSQNMFDRQRDGVDYHRNKTHCPMAHTLEAPNLVPSQLAIGQRTCLACSRAYSNQRKARLSNKTIDLRAKANEHYAKIMSTASS